MKRIVTVIVVWVTLCLIGTINQDITTKAATKEKLQQFTLTMTDKNAPMLSIKNSELLSAKITKNTGATNKNDNKSKSTKKKNTTYEPKDKKKKYSDIELKYMTSIIYCEARGESYESQKAVGIVVMNRKRSDLFPNGIKRVIYQKGQFSPVTNGSLDRALRLYDKYNDNGKFKDEMKSCLKAAKEVLEGTTTIKVDGKKKEMKDYLFFSGYIPNAKFILGKIQFK